MKPSSLGVAMAALALNGCEVENLPLHSPHAATVQQDLASSTTVHNSPKAKEAPLSQLGGKSDVVSPVDSSLGAIQEKIAALLAKGVVVLRPDGSDCRKTTVVGAQIDETHRLKPQIDQIRELEHQADKILASDRRPHIASHEYATGTLEASSGTTFFVPYDLDGIKITGLRVPSVTPASVKIKIDPNGTLINTCHVHSNRYEIGPDGKALTKQGVLPVDESPEKIPAGRRGITLSFKTPENFKHSAPIVFVITRSDGVRVSLPVKIEAASETVADVF